MKQRIGAIIFATVFTLPLIAVMAQRPATGVRSVPGAVATGSQAATEAPQLKTEDQLKIRNLQYSQAKVVLEMKQIEARYKELQQQGAAIQSGIDEAVTVAAKNAGVDLAKWIFDSDKLKFVPRPHSKPETPNSKP